jgi:hypothetical protein
MACTGLDKAYYYSYDGSEGIVLTVSRDEEYIKNLIEVENEFYEKMVSFEPPSLTERDYILKDDDIWTATASDYLKVKNAISDLEKREKELKSNLITMANRANARGAGIRLSKIMRQGAVNYTSIPELDGVNLNAYRKSPVETWRIIAD